MTEKHCLGRRARGDAAFGSERIVIGMRRAIRDLKTSRLSRREIADFAGVTPPLVSYYFPDRDSLLEAATLPVVRSFADEVGRCLSQVAPPERVLWDVIALIIGSRARDGAIIDAYATYRENSLLQRSNPLNAIRQEIKLFFESWLRGSRNASYYALLSQVALLAMCEYFSSRAVEDEAYHCQLVYQVIMSIVGDAEIATSETATATDVCHKLAESDTGPSTSHLEPASVVARTTLHATPTPL